MSNPILIHKTIFEERKERVTMVQEASEHRHERR